MDKFIKNKYESESVSSGSEKEEKEHYEEFNKSSTQNLVSPIGLSGQEIYSNNSDSSRKDSSKVKCEELKENKLSPQVNLDQKARKSSMGSFSSKHILPSNIEVKYHNPQLHMTPEKIGQNSIKQTFPPGYPQQMYPTQFVPNAHFYQYPHLNPATQNYSLNYSQMHVPSHTSYYSSPGVPQYIPYIQQPQIYPSPYGIKHSSQSDSNILLKMKNNAMASSKGQIAMPKPFIQNKGFVRQEMGDAVQFSDGDKQKAAGVRMAPPGLESRSVSSKVAGVAMTELEVAGPQEVKVKAVTETRLAV